MEYKIIGFDEKTGALQIEYAGKLKIGILLTVDDSGKVPVGQELINVIESFAPTYELERLNNIETQSKKCITNADAIKVLIEPASDIKDPILDSDLKTAQAWAINSISGKCGILRNKFNFSNSGQDYSYLIKRIQAFQFKEANFIGKVPSYIQAEMDLTNKSAKAIAESIIAKSEKYTEEIDPRIEAARSVTIDAIANASTVEQIDAAFKKGGIMIQNIDTDYKAFQSTLLVKVLV